jgi:hypothetical protein
LQFRFDGKPCLLTLGEYPGMTLYEARALGLRHKEDIKRGINSTPTYFDCIFAILPVSWLA